MSLGLLGLVAAQLVASLVVGWFAGDLLVEWLAARRRRPGAELGAPERALAAVVGFCGFAVGLMLAHLVTAGAVFGVAWFVPAAALVLVIARARAVRLPKLPGAALALAGAVLGAIYVLPVVYGGPGTRTGDPPLHMAWTAELLAGEPVPTGPAPEFGRNAYPWGYHAVLATMVRLVPGSDALVAQEAMHVVLVLAIPLAAACLGRALDRRSGWVAAACASLVGGFGWLLADGPAFSISPRAARFGADLVVASPNSVYELFPPALPRELGLVLLASFGLFLTQALVHGSRAVAVVAGACLGLAGLVSVPMLLSGIVWAVAALAWSRGAARRLALPFVAPAVLLFATWAAPVASNYLRYGGFVDVTPRLGFEWPLGAALSSWGLLLPAAVAGALVVAIGRSRDAARGALIAFGLATAAMLALTLVRAVAGWQLQGNETLLHQGRVWPVAHLLAAAFAGAGLWSLYERLRARWRLLAIGVAAVALAVAVLSPALASARLAEILASDDARSGYIYGSPELARGSFVRRAAAHLTPSDVVEVQGARSLALLLFQFSGCRVAAYDDPALAENDLRIRYRDLARAWQRRVATGGFAADYVVYPVVAGARPANAVEVGRFRGRTWALVKL